MSSVLITGASGFIGSHLLRRLSDRRPAICSDFSQLEALFAAHPFTHVYHLAAAGVRAGDEAQAPCVQCNTVGTFELARLAIRRGVKRFVYAGSGLEYGAQSFPLDETAPLAPLNVYGASKAAGWLLLDYLRREEGLPLVTLRPFAVYGPGEHPSKLIPYVLSQARAREPIRLAGGEQMRDYIYVEDAVDALIAAATEPDAAGVYNLGAGPERARSVRAIVERILDIAGAPASLCDFGAAARTRRDPPYLVADPTRAWTELGWRARVSLEEGLRRTAQAMGCEAS